MRAITRDENNKYVSAKLGDKNGRKTFSNITIDRLVKNDHISLSALGPRARFLASKLLRGASSRWLPKPFAVLLDGSEGAITTRAHAIDALLYFVALASKATQVMPALDPTGGRLHGVILFANALSGYSEHGLSGEAIADIFQHVIQKLGFGIVPLDNELTLDVAFAQDHELQRIVTDHISACGATQSAVAAAPSKQAHKQGRSQLTQR
jgi:hypothetical protein